MLRLLPRPWERNPAEGSYLSRQRDGTYPPHQSYSIVEIGEDELWFSGRSRHDE